eukprot:188165-Chlamydomonas_euryale.AAC.4
MGWDFRVRAPQYDSRSSPARGWSHSKRLPGQPTTVGCRDGKSGQENKGERAGGRAALLVGPVIGRSGADEWTDSKRLAGRPTDLGLRRAEALAHAGGGSPGCGSGGRRRAPCADESQPSQAGGLIDGFSGPHAPERRLLGDLATAHACAHGMARPVGPGAKKK